MDTQTARRFARQIQLSEVGPEGQERIGAARVVVAGGGVAAEIAVTYLRAAGVGAVIEVTTLPTDGAGWLAVLADTDAVVRAGFDDDAMLAAATRLGVAAVVFRARPDAVDVVSKPRRDPVPDAPIDIPVRAAVAGDDSGAGAVVAGTLAAAEALHALLRSSPADGHARHLRFPLDGGEPLAQQVGAR